MRRSHRRGPGAAAVLFLALPALAQATWRSYGDGCYNRASSFYEVFVPASTNRFDLNNSSVQLTLAGAGYYVTPGSSQWFSPAANTHLSLADDVVSAALPLGFTLPYPGGTTNTIYVSSNGFVWLQPSTDSGGGIGADPNDLLVRGPRHCPFWSNLDPSAGGSVNFDVDPSNGAAYVTFTAVPLAYSTAGPSTFQVAFFATGVVEYRYQTCMARFWMSLTGWSPGVHSLAGQVDISASMPFLTSQDQWAPILSANSAPVLGLPVTLVAVMQTPSPAAVLVLSLTKHDPGLDLGPLGMPGCRQYVGLDVSLPMLTTNGPGFTTLYLPNNPAYAGTHLLAQSFLLGSGWTNPLGVIASNGLDLLCH
jgi:hypothetical protein